MKEFIGIDNGRTGAVARLGADGSVTVEPVRLLDLGKECLLDVKGNISLLREMLSQAEVPPEQVLIAYEQSQINPLFGARNNFTNGRHGEFWRVLLSMEGLPFVWVDPRTWQKELFKGIRGNRTKDMAALVCQQRFPWLDLSRFTLAQIVGIRDALCIALWARQHWATHHNGSISVNALPAQPVEAL